MIATFKDENGKEKKIKIEAKRGKPFADRYGMVKIVGGKFKGLTKISLEVLEDRFVLGAN